MSNNRKRHSTNDTWRSHPYLRGIPIQEIEHAVIDRDKKTGHVRIIRNGLVTYDSKQSRL